MRTPAALFAVVCALGCRSGRTQPARPDAAATTGVTSVAGPTAAARFSRPIAATRAPGGVTLVSGLSAPTGAIVVTAIGPDGSTRWTHDAIPGVAWSPNATVNLFAGPSGAAVVWRGRRGGGDTTVAEWVGLDGRLEGEPFPVGIAACATATELAWFERGPKAAWLVRTLPFGTSSAASPLSLPEERDPALLCATHTVFALGDGDDDVTLSVVGDHTRAPVRVIQDAEFRGDEERGHEVYSVGDVPGIVRLGLGGSVAVREIDGGHSSPWRRFGKKLAEADDVTLVDADAREGVLVFSRDASAPGDVGGKSSVEALVWQRSGARDVSYELAPPDATLARGPFWSGAVPGGVVVAWAERSKHNDAGLAPILGLAYRVVSLDALGDVHRIERPADDLVDAGCDESRCYAVALARASGEDGGQPEVAAVLAYP